MRTTLALDNELMREVKARAARTGITVTALVSRALRELVAHEEAPRATYHLKMPTVTGALRHGVDLADRDRLHDLMDGRA